MASRRKGRILAFQALYSWEAMRPSETLSRHGLSEMSSAPGLMGKEMGEMTPIPEELLNFSWLESDKQENLDQATADFSRLLVTGTVQNIKPVDEMIRSHLENWDFSRLNRVDLALLRMSTYTLMFQSDVPPSIVIDEAIGISKEFGTGDSFRFVNGVLDSIRRTLQSPQAVSGRLYDT
jgi:N utilization substance protein B